MLTRLSNRWAAAVFRYPWVIVLIALLLTGLSGYLATRIEIRSSFSNLLPDNSQAVKDLEVISKRIGGMGTLIVLVEGTELSSMQRFADALVERLRHYPKEEVRFVDHKIDAQKAFFERHKFLYLEVDELTELHQEIKKSIDREKAKANPFFVDLSDDDEKKEKPFDFKAKKEKYEKYLRKFDNYIDGYLTNKEGTQLIVVIKTPASSTGVEFAKRITKKVQAEIDDLDPGQFHASLKTYLTGELNTLPEEYEALRNDIVVVSNICVLLVLLAVTLYYRSVRMTIIMGAGLLGGVITTFGLVYLKIGYLTAATAFLAAIVAGNGVNFGIYFLARYMEERQKNDPLVDTLARSLKGTITSVSTAALAAGASYASLMGTQFKGFNQFGFIGGVGMVVCLLFALTLNPALVVLMERYLPFKKVSVDRYQRGRIFSGAAAWLVERHPKKVLTMGVVAVLASVLTLAVFLRDPFEYNFRKLRNQFSEKVGSGAQSDKAEDILGERSAPHIILADSFEQVPRIKHALRGYMMDNPDPQKQAIKFIKTIYDYLPGSEEEQQEKIALIGKIRALVVGTDFGDLSEEDRADIKELTPPSDLAVVTPDSLPEELVRPYVELDGTRGTLMYADMHGSIWNGKYLHRFAEPVREIKLDNGEIVRSSGKAVIFSDMIRYVTDEGPYATGGAFLLVLVIIIVAFRKVNHILRLALSMANGVVVLMMGVAVVFGQ